MLKLPADTTIPVPLPTFMAITPQPAKVDSVIEKLPPNALKTVPVGPPLTDVTVEQSIVMAVCACARDGQAAHTTSAATDTSTRKLVEGWFIRRGA